MLGIEEYLIHNIILGADDGPWSMFLFSMIATFNPCIFLIPALCEFKGWKKAITYFIGVAIPLVFFGNWIGLPLYRIYAIPTYIQRVDQKTWETDKGNLMKVTINTDKSYTTFSNVQINGYVFRISKGGWAYREVKPDLSEYFRIKYRTAKGILLENGDIIPDEIPIETEENSDVLSKLLPGEYYVRDAKIIRIILDD